ncbi:SET (Su(var)3-9, Enhancer-of-zeste, Trithorax) domain [Rhizoctonia solani]|uniref:SET (Su(Var)3-9, Enhancer-of-zeste, Trithorax) domain n=1 Tax=Rhizoctonia solani TaxID=456999 RepID=A0A8H7II66_9AGAM|nr:SET (Su(var)3-9, Enhancer-of-zeste, Trithorax) domain [Rhizoctonia solani]
MNQSKAPARWPNNVEYLVQSILDPKFPKESRELLVVGPDVPPSQLAGRSSQRIPVTIKIIDNPNHPAFGQRGLFACGKIAANSFILPYIGEIHSDDREDSDYDLSLHRACEISIGVDASRKGNEARFVNDFRGIQPKPNATFRQGADCRGWLEMSIWSGPLSIKKGEEILVSYGKGWWKARQALLDPTETKTGNTEETIAISVCICVAPI